MTLTLPPIEVPPGAEPQARRLIESFQRITQFAGDPAIEGSTGPRLVAASFDHSLETAKAQLPTHPAKPLSKS